MMGETIFPPAFLSFVLDPNGTQLVDAAADDHSGEQIPFATEDPTAPLLSPREKLILRCRIEGGSNKSIARKIDIAEATVKGHVKAILPGVIEQAPAPPRGPNARQRFFSSTSRVRAGVQPTYRSLDLYL